MKKHHFFWLLLPLFSYSQEIENKNLNISENKKGSLFLGFGSEYRITPYYNNIPKTDSYTNVDAQNSGYALNYFLTYFMSKKLNINFSHSFRYDLLLNSNIEPLNNGISLRKADKTLIMDYSVYFDYNAFILKKGKIFLRLGLAMMNNETNYTKTESYYNIDGSSAGYISEEKDFSYFATNYGLGYNKNKLNVLVGIYRSNNTPYFNKPATMTIPYLKLEYSILNF